MTQPGLGQREKDESAESAVTHAQYGSTSSSVGCAIWGVLNVTPDSFSDGGRFDSLERALAHADAMVRAGADVIDVGGESTRPKGKTYGAGFEEVGVDEEVRRTLPVIEALRQRHPDVELSIDTTKPEVAKRALSAGARYLNDVGGGRDVRLLEVAADGGADLVLMHNRHRGEVEGDNTRYDDVVADVLRELMGAVEKAVSLGIPRARLWLDPGIGFAKTAAQSAELLAATTRFVATGYPVLVGPSRKSFIAELAPNADGQRPGPDARLFGTAAAVTAAVLGGAHAVRVHDVTEMKQVVAVALAMRDALHRDGARAGRGAAA